MHEVNSKVATVNLLFWHRLQYFYAKKNNIGTPTTGIFPLLFTELASSAVIIETVFPGIVCHSLI